MSDFPDLRFKTYVIPPNLPPPKDGFYPDKRDYPELYDEFFIEEEEEEEEAIEDPDRVFFCWGYSDTYIERKAREKYILHSSLMMAVNRGNLSQVETILKRGDDVNYRDHKGRSAITIALNRTPDIEMMKLLMSNGADINVEDYYGITALRSIPPKSAYIPRSFDDIRKILERWPATMAIIVLQELLVFNNIDDSLRDSLIDLNEFIGK